MSRQIPFPQDQLVRRAAIRFASLAHRAVASVLAGAVLFGWTLVAAGDEPEPRRDSSTSVPVLHYVQPADEPAQPAEPSPLAELEQLLERPVVVPALEQEVTTVSRQESTVGRSPAAVFVITNDMLRRSGATTIAEALRMVPGMDVARIDNANWAISSRGFPDRFANKLLVHPLFKRVTLR